MISVLVPVYNEEKAVAKTLAELNKALGAYPEREIIVINDGSTDNTLAMIENCGVKNIRIINHPDNLGYGKSLFDGIAVARYECIVIIDGDGSYPVNRINDLCSYFPKYDMVVGARQGREYSKGIFKRPARLLFEFLVRYASGRDVPDVNSGLRIFKKSIIMNFHDSLCTGFSFTTTLTLIFLLNQYYIKYVPIEYFKREGKSKVRHFKDTLRAGQIIIEAILYYNPIKLFLLIAFLNLVFGIVLGIVNHFFFKLGFLTITAAVCVAGFIPIFSAGLIADQLKKIYKLSKVSKT